MGWEGLKQRGKREKMKYFPETTECPYRIWSTELIFWAYLQKKCSLLAEFKAQLN